MNKKILRLFFKPLSIMNKFTTKDSRMIFFYSNLGFRDNVKALYDYLIEEKFNMGYKIVVSINDFENFKDNAPDNVTFVNNKEGIKYFMKSKYAFYCFGKYPIKPSKKQMVVNLWHGMPLKKIGNMEPGLEKIDYNFFTKIVSTSELFNPILMKSFNCTENQVMITGQPRNDEMFKVDKITDSAIRRGADKVILWLPTYRNEEKSFPTPVLSQEQADILNEILKVRNARIVIKIHPLQKLAGKLKKYSYIEFVTQEELNKSGMTVYTLLRAADALITDYSSVYFDYMMLDRPIAFTVDDIEDYEKTRGFVFENPYEYMPGLKISTFDDIKKFVADVVAGRDEFSAQRRELNKKINKYSDGESCKRVVKNIFRRHG